MEHQRVTFVPSALQNGPRPAEREIFIKTPTSGPMSRPIVSGGIQHG
ncbi:MAG: hypothetical protein SOY94_11170 [Candidatus Limiplasma sp.]|nr:hypothetical protein [Candidatus Limiplasma sp.]